VKTNRFPYKPFFHGSWLTSILLLALIAGPLKAGANPTDTSSQWPLEQVIIQTDRSLYMTGETVWFRADCFVDQIKPSRPLSKVLYLEVFNQKEDPLIQKKYKLSDNQTTGQFTLPANAASGTYMLRAYTLYQRNFAPEGFAQQQLIVVNPDIPPEKTSSNNQPAIQLVPQGGTLLTGIPTKVAGQLRRDLRQKTSSIQLIDQHGKEIAPVQHWRNGLVKTAFTPRHNIKPSLRITLDNGDTLQKKLPEAQISGIKGETYLSSRYINYTLYTKKEKEAGREANHRLDVYNSSLVKVSQHRIHGHSSSQTIQIPRKGLTPGMHYLLLRNPEGSQIRIHPVYLPPEPPSKVIIGSNRNTYKRREKIRLHIQPQGFLTGKSKNLSVSIVRKGTHILQPELLPAPCIKNPNLLHHQISMAGQYTEDMNEQVEAASILQEESIVSKQIRIKGNGTQSQKLEFIPETRDLTISGTILNPNTQQPIAKSRIMASVLFDNPQLHQRKSNEKGEFIFTLHNLKGNQEIFLCPVPGKNHSTAKRIRLNSNFSPVDPYRQPLPFPLTSSDEPLLNELLFNKEIEQKLNPAAGESTPEKSSDRKKSLITSHENIIVRMKDYIDLETMEQVFLELVPHARIFQREGQYHFELLNNKNYALPGDPLLLLDNLPVFDPGKLVELHPSLIQKIEVINRTYMIGENVYNGIILFTSNTNNFGEIEFHGASVFTEYQTLSNDQAWHKRIHTSEKMKDREIPDFRTLLYWNPDLKVSDEGTPITFYASDRTGQYDIIVRGYDQDGRWYYGSHTIEITRKGVESNPD